jgi:hypothetical protein
MQEGNSSSSHHGSPCPRCGRASRPNSKFCAHCGARLLADEPTLGARSTVAAEEAHPSPPVEPGVEGVPARHRPAPRRNRRGVYLAVALVVCLAATATALGIIMSGRPATTLTSAANGPTTLSVKNSSLQETTTSATQTTTTTLATTTTASTSTTTAASAADTTDVELPVRVLDTASGGDPLQFDYPTRISAPIPAEWAQQVAAYGVAGIVILAPKGWTASDAGIGANGTSGLMLQSTGSSAIAGTLEYEQTAGRVVAGWDRAAQYFSWVHDQWRDSGLPDELSDSGLPNDPPDLRPGMVATIISRQLIKYRIAPNDNAGEGEVNGIARTGIGVDGDGDSFVRLEVVLPPDARDLATAILDFYMAHKDDSYLR